MIKGSRTNVDRNHFCASPIIYRLVYGSRAPVKRPREKLVIEKSAAVIRKPVVSLYIWTECRDLVFHELWLTRQNVFAPDDEISNASYKATSFLNTHSYASAPLTSSLDDWSVFGIACSRHIQVVLNHKITGLSIRREGNCQMVPFPFDNLIGRYPQGLNTCWVTLNGWLRIYEAR